MKESSQLFCWISCLYLLLQHVSCYTMNYSGYKVFEIHIDSEQTWKQLQILLDSDAVDVWHWPSVVGDTVQILLSPDQTHQWTKAMIQLQLPWKVTTNDAQVLIDAEISKLNQLNSLGPGRRHYRSVGREDEPEPEVIHRLSGRFPSFTQVESWLKDLDSEVDIVTLLDIGSTAEGRKLYVLQISAANDPLTTPAIWIDTGVHAREWISHTTGIYTIEHLIEEYYHSSKVRALVENLVWYIMPIANPDGYVYSHIHDRYWRKNRSPPPAGVRHGYLNKTCIGVDLNRNFDFQWGSAGISGNSCSVVYLGHQPNSELETQAMTTFLLEHRPQVQAYFSLHSYHQAVFTRWAYTDEAPQDFSQMLSVVDQMVQAIKNVHNEEYISGRTGKELYIYSGGSADWAKAKAGIKYSFTAELRDKGKHGFVLPPENIVPVGEEMFAAIVTLGQHVHDHVVNTGLAINITGQIPDNHADQKAESTFQDISTTTDPASKNIVLPTDSKATHGHGTLHTWSLLLFYLINVVVN